MRRIVIGICLLFAVIVPALAQERHALLIGNTDYEPKVGALKNPVNDITLVSAALTKIGFNAQKQSVLSNQKRAQILAAVRAYAGRLALAGENAIGFLYYSGHGAAEQGTNVNFLVPVDATDPEDDSFWDASVRLDDVLAILRQRAPRALHFVVVDACRNELLLPTKGGTKGLAPIPTPTGMLVGFATEFGKTASDVGIGGGPYAKVLAAEIVKPGVHNLDLFQNVAEAVAKATSFKQQPYTLHGLGRRVYLAGEAPVVVSAGSAATTEKLPPDIARHWHQPFVPTSVYDTAIEKFESETGCKPSQSSTVFGTVLVSVTKDPDHGDAIEKCNAVIHSTTRPKVDIARALLARATLNNRTQISDSLQDLQDALLVDAFPTRNDIIRLLRLRNIYRLAAQRPHLALQDSDALVSVVPSPENRARRIIALTYLGEHATVDRELRDYAADMAGSFKDLPNWVAYMRSLPQRDRYSDTYPDDELSLEPPAVARLKALPKLKKAELKTRLGATSKSCGDLAFLKSSGGAEFVFQDCQKVVPASDTPVLVKEFAIMSRAVYVALTLGRADLAFRDVKSILEGQPSTLNTATTALELIGAYYGFVRDDKSRADAIAATIIAIDPNHFDTNLALAAEETTAGKFAAAIRRLERAASSAESDEERRKVAEQLKETREQMAAKSVSPKAPPPGAPLK